MIIVLNTGMLIAKENMLPSGSTDVNRSVKSVMKDLSLTMAYVIQLLYLWEIQIVPKSTQTESAANASQEPIWTETMSVDLYQINVKNGVKKLVNAHAAILDTT